MQKNHRFKFVNRIIGVIYFITILTTVSCGYGDFRYNRNEEPYGACSEDSGIINAAQCSTSSNRYVYTDLFGGRAGNCSTGGNASACWTNASNQYVSSLLGTAVSGANGSLTATIPAAYYDGSMSATMSDTNLTAANIKSGITIFGTLGNYLGNFRALMSSGAYHDKATTQISLEAETTTYAGTTNLPLPSTGGSK